MNTDPRPDNTAVRTALWRALHIQTDALPHIIEDAVGLQLIAPEPGWQQRPDMHPEFTKRLRASMVARARFIEDLILGQSGNGIGQYVLLGAGLDSFAQRRPDVAARLQVYEIDQPDTQLWKQQRLQALDFGLPEWLHFVSVDFEKSSWWQELLKAGFNLAEPAVAACTGVTLYLTENAIRDTLRQLATLAPGSALAIAFYLPLHLMAPEDRPLQEIATKGAREAGTPFVSFFAPADVLQLAEDAGFKNSKIITTKELELLYFANRTDGLLPASGEIFLLAET
ncbi:class I SAM-dependent methyltransferase [Niabella drilacis]|uniref:S-adenosyl-L-methionine-dependent methyltransferase n=1 Tax=Niabella drilacis (strain DSM 25811 / CCM 8410 / CCUG 62505 / LMG 26954 / E90) TaxID=1285928 RepID=A0A1G6WU97_NIADE|nr:class I SAM-dependent methyltransferase [Niabella drilacis]SDD69223.1 methyltransferase, TIGR00027 family [Niabella drilacis]